MSDHTPKSKAKTNADDAKPETKLPPAKKAKTAVTNKGKQKLNYMFDDTTAVLFTEGSHYCSFKCRIEGIPRPQYRSFATTKASGGKTVKMWSPSKAHQQSFAKAFKEAMKKAGAVFPCNDKVDSQRCLYVTAKLYFPRPKKHFDYDHPSKTYKLSPNAPVFATNYPDLDNCVKLILHSLQGIICVNDCQIVSLNVVKLYDTSMTIWRDKDNSLHEKLNNGCTLIKVVSVNPNVYIERGSCTCPFCMAS